MVPEDNSVDLEFTKALPKVEVPHTVFNNVCGWLMHNSYTLTLAVV
jgi:hypothetical protein